MAEKDLTQLLKNLSPRLIPGDFVFLTVQEDEVAEFGKTPLALFREEEAVTIVIERSFVDRSKRYLSQPIWALITLTVNSDLEAVGLIAAVSNALKAQEIPVNVFSAFFHDHLFVPKSRAKEALEVLQGL